MKSYHEAKEQLMLIWTQQHHHPFPIRLIRVLIRSEFRDRKLYKFKEFLSE